MSDRPPKFPADVVTAVGAASIDQMKWEPLRGLSGVDHKVLWHSQEMTIGLIRLQPGAEEPGHAHDDAQHYLYVVHGNARIGGHLVKAGGFVVVPADVTHATTDVGPEGCTLFYTFVRTGSPVTRAP
jgi:quercetin dioxygenase-like cupin family protein